MGHRLSATVIACAAVLALLAYGDALATGSGRNHAASPQHVSWAGAADYRGAQQSLEFVVTGSRVTTFFLGYDCQHQSDGYTTEGQENFRASVPISRGAFKLDYTTTVGDDVHLLFQGTFRGGSAQGTLDVLEDKNLGGACNVGTAAWKAHRVD